MNSQRKKTSEDTRVAKRKYSVIDVFSGIGGMSLGFVQNGNFQVAAAVEIDADAATAYEKNIGIKPIVDDIRNVSGRKLLKRANLRKWECTVLIGCAPCQSFSAHRRGRKKRAIDSVRNSLPFAWLSIISDVMPRHVCFENVPGLVKAARGTIFEQFIGKLEGLGYKVAWSIENAADHGIPQSRKRLLVVGSRIVEPEIPPRTHGDPKSENVNSGSLNPWTTVRDAFDGLVVLSSGESDENDPYHAARVQQPIVLKRLQHIGEGQSHLHLPKHLRLDCHKNHGGHPDVYGRMKWDAPAPTLTGGCTNLTKGRFAHPKQNRSITLREAMRLQTFPDDTTLAGSREKMQLQVGNAVPPLLARRIADIILQMEATASAARRRPSKRPDPAARVPKSAERPSQRRSMLQKPARRARNSRRSSSAKKRR